MRTRIARIPSRLAAWRRRHRWRALRSREIAELFPCGCAPARGPAPHDRDCAAGVIVWLRRELARPRTARRTYHGDPVVPPPPDPPPPAPRCARCGHAMPANRRGYYGPKGPLCPVCIGTAARWPVSDPPPFNRRR